jgi:hypothetical protein
MITPIVTDAVLIGSTKQPGQFNLNGDGTVTNVLSVGTLTIGQNLVMRQVTGGASGTGNLILQGTVSANIAAANVTANTISVGNAGTFNFGNTTGNKVYMTYNSSTNSIDTLFY